MSLISTYAGCHLTASMPRCGVLGTATPRVPRAEPRYLGEAVALLRCALRFARGVAQGEHDGPLIEGCHVLQQLLSESACNSRDTCNSNCRVRWCFPTV